MIKARIQIEDGELYDITDQFGFVYINGDKIFSAPIKEFEKTSYPEQPGYNIYPKTVDDGFEYKVKLFIKADTKKAIVLPSRINHVPPRIELSAV